MLIETQYLNKGSYISRSNLMHIKYLLIEKLQYKVLSYFDFYRRVRYLRAFSW